MLLRVNRSYSRSVTAALRGANLRPREFIKKNYFVLVKMNLILSKFIWKNGTRFNQYMFATIITIPLLSFGMVQGWLSPMLTVLQSPNSPSSEPYSSTDISWMTSVTYITAIIFGAPMGYLTDRFGRKAMTLFTLVCLMAYWSIKIFSLKPWALILARAIAGVPCSSCYIVLPIYIKEICDIDLRGALGSMLILNRNIGYLISYICADFMEIRMLSLLSLMVPTIVFLLFLGMPETPEFLVKQGKVEEAKAILAWLRGVSLVDRVLEEDIDKMTKLDKETQVDPKSTWKIILSDRTTLKAFIITIVIKVSQQFDGYLIVLIFAGFIFEKASDSISLQLSPNKQVMMIGVVQLLGSIVGTCIVEKTGRKLYINCYHREMAVVVPSAMPALQDIIPFFLYLLLLLVITSFAVGSGMLVLSAWFYVTSQTIWLPGWLPVLAMCLCIFADAAGYQPISYIIITDLFTFQLRGTVSCIANICAKMSNFIQTKWFNEISMLIGIHWTFLFFAVVCFTGCCYTVICFPETRQKTIEEIYEKIASKNKSKDVEITPC